MRSKRTYPKISWLLIPGQVLSICPGGDVVWLIILLHVVGKMFATVGALQSLSGMVGTAIFNTVYPHTFNFWPGFCFTLGTIIGVIPLALIM